jgi:hypothetical protein
LSPLLGLSPLPFYLFNFPNMKSPALLKARRAFAAACKVYRLIPYENRPAKVAAYINLQAAAAACAAARK